MMRSIYFVLIIIVTIRSKVNPYKSRDGTSTFVVAIFGLNLLLALNNATNEYRIKELMLFVRRLFCIVLLKIIRKSWKEESRPHDSNVMRLYLRVYLNVIAKSKCQFTPGRRFE